MAKPSHDVTCYTTGRTVHCTLNWSIMGTVIAYGRRHHRFGEMDPPQTIKHPKFGSPTTGGHHDDGASFFLGS